MVWPSACLPEYSQLFTSESREMRITGSAHALCTFACLLSALTISCVDRAESGNTPQPPPSQPVALVGTWVRVYPPPAGEDTLVLNEDGSAAGALGTVNEFIPHISRWQVGAKMGPEDLCIGDEGFTCQGYRLRNDTLALANAEQTVLVRAELVHLTVGDTAVAKDRAAYGESAPAPTFPGRLPER